MQHFFAAPASNAPSRRLLLVTFHFPPGTAVGALRWQRLLPHFAEAGWIADIVTAAAEDLKSADHQRLAELPLGSRVFGVPARPLLIDRLELALYNLVKPRFRQIPEGSSTAGAAPVRSLRQQSLTRHETAVQPWSLRRLVRWYYATLLHKRHMAWARAATRAAHELARDTRYDVIISSGPPHEAHVAAADVSRRFLIPHVVDLRDPWSMVERVPEVIASPSYYDRAKVLERDVLLSAALIVSNTERARRAMVTAYPQLERRSVTIMNGFDQELLPPSAPGDRFVVAYAGSIYLDRDPSALFAAAARVIKQRSLTPEQFSIEFMGHEEVGPGGTILELAQRAGIVRHVRVHPPASRAEALAFLARAAMLVSLPQDSRAAIPAKVFEYMRFDAWLLALADRDSATADLLEGSGADIAEPENVDAIAAALLRRYEAFRRGELPRQPALVPSASRATQAEKLLAAIDDLVLAPEATA